MPQKRARRGRGEGSISQRSDGLWVASISLGVHGKKRTRRVVYGHSKTEAIAKLHDLQLLAGQLPDAGNITLETWLTRWLELIKPSVEPGTHQPYQIHVKKHLVPRIGGVKLRQLRPVDVELLYARLLKEGVKPPSVRKIGTTLSIALNHAVRSQLIPSNPAHGVRRPKAAKAAIQVLTSEQVAAFVRACAGERLGPLFLFILDSGCRPGEALALTWKDIDFDGGRVSLTKSLENSGRVKAPKTPRSRRQVELTKIGLDALHAHRKAMLAEGRNVRGGGTVFVNISGGHILPNDVTRGHLRPILDRAKLPAVTCYALRHTCATLLLAANVNPKIVSERLGHGSISITMDTYSHVIPGMQRGAVEALAKALGALDG